MLYQLPPFSSSPRPPPLLLPPFSSLSPPPPLSLSLFRELTLIFWTHLFYSKIFSCKCSLAFSGLKQRNVKLKQWIILLIRYFWLMSVVYHTIFVLKSSGLITNFMWCSIRTQDILPHNLTSIRSPPTYLEPLEVGISSYVKFHIIQCSWFCKLLG